MQSSLTDDAVRELVVDGFSPAVQSPSPHRSGKLKQTRVMSATAGERRTLPLTVDLSDCNPHPWAHSLRWSPNRLAPLRQPPSPAQSRLAPIASSPISSGAPPRARAWEPGPCGQCDGGRARGWALCLFILSGYSPRLVRLWVDPCSPRWRSRDTIPCHTSSAGVTQRTVANAEPPGRGHASAVRNGNIHESKGHRLL